MFTTSTVLTLSLAKAFGVYMIAAGLGGLVAPGKWRTLLEEFRNGEALTYVTAIFVYILGVAIILTHNLWTDPLAILISLVGWVAAIEGVVLMVAPKPLLDFAASLTRPGAMKALAVGVIGLGAIIALLGFVGVAA